MNYPTHDAKLAEVLGLGYQEIATALGVTRQAVRNAVVKGSGYLTIDRLIQVYVHLDEGAKKLRLGEAIQERLPWSMGSDERVGLDDVLAQPWRGIWVIAPALRVVESLCRTLARTAHRADSAAVAMILPQVGDAELGFLKSLFEKSGKDAGGVLRFAVAEMPSAALFPALLVEFPRTGKPSIFSLGERGLVKVPPEQQNAMALFALDPWQGNESVRLQNVYATKQGEITLKAPPAAASRPESDHLNLRFHDDQSLHGDVTVTFDRTRTGWWWTVDSDELASDVRSVALTADLDDKEAKVFHLLPDEIPNRGPWPLAEVLPAELIVSGNLRIVMEII